jgi:hypothetical protein
MNHNSAPRGILFLDSFSPDTALGLPLTAVILRAWLEMRLARRLGAFLRVTPGHRAAMNPE